MNSSRKDAKIAKMDENGTGKEVVDAAIAVHRELGPALLETVYEVVLFDELRQRGLDAQRQVPTYLRLTGM
jgi:GxxExxY protein